MYDFFTTQIVIFVNISHISLQQSGSGHDVGGKAVAGQNDRKGCKEPLQRDAQAYFLQFGVQQLFQVRLMTLGIASPLTCRRMKEMIEYLYTNQPDDPLGYMLARLEERKPGDRL